MKRVLLLAVLALTSCATSPQERGRREAVIQKSVADGVGKAYIEYCEVVRKPICITEAEEYEAEHGIPNTTEDRIECLKPCDSATAEKLARLVDEVRSAQSILFLVLKKQHASESEIEESRRQLRASIARFTQYIQDTGVVETLGEAFGTWKK